MSCMAAIQKVLVQRPKRVEILGSAGYRLDGTSVTTG